MAQYCGWLAGDDLQLEQSILFCIHSVPVRSGKWQVCTYCSLGQVSIQAHKRSGDIGKMPAFLFSAGDTGRFPSPSPEGEASVQCPT